jgi:hypothetical protein
MKDHDNASPTPLPRSPAVYYRVKKTNGKWKWVPAQRYGYQHERCVQIAAYVYTEEDE